MAFIPTPGAVRVDIQFTATGQQLHNVIWCYRDSAWTEAQRQALADAIAAWWGASAKQYFPTTTALTQVTVVNQEASNSPATTLVVSPAVPGTSAGGALQNNVSTCATLRTENRGRSFRGRMYLGQVSASSVVDAISMSAGWVANIVTMLSALKTAIEALGALWVVVSHYTNKIPRAAGLKTEITAISADQYYDSQRRRLGLRGV